MQIKNITNWNYTPQMEGLLFFANIIDEMTFNYTLDSFKASVHNVFSLMSECIETINDIQDETIKKGALPPILEEINNAIIHDHFFNKVIQSKGYDLLVPKIIANTPNKELKLILEMLLSEEVFEQYNDCLKAELSDLIKTKPNHKKNIEKYSRLFVAQMRFMGYPNASVHMKNKDFFFGISSNIQSVNDIDVFLVCLILKDRTIMAQITDGNTEEEKLCALICLQKYNPQRSQIMTDASAAHFFLLRYRLWKLNIRMGSVKNVKATYTRFKERMRWHITRLYRTRNLIVHAGAHPVYLDMLLENIHSFYDLFMKELLTDITVHNALKLEYSYILHGQRYMEYKQYLEELDNGVAVNTNNYLKRKITINR